MLVTMVMVRPNAACSPNLLTIFSIERPTTLNPLFFCRFQHSGLRAISPGPRCWFPGPLLLVRQALSQRRDTRTKLAPALVRYPWRGAATQQNFVAAPLLIIHAGPATSCLT